MVSDMSKEVNVLEFPKAKSIVVSGDIHGDFTQLVSKCCVQYGMTDTLIIVAGDCGFGFEQEGYYEGAYKQCSARLSKANNWLLFVRGNHDNPAYFNQKPIKHKRWMTLPDYSVVKACGHTILCVGGATSIDRLLRVTAKRYHLNPGETLVPNVYWNNEAPVFDKGILDEIDQMCAIDTVITHTAPSFCELTSHVGLLDWAEYDGTLLKDVENERKAMDSLFDYLYVKNHPLRHWFYGHFHQSWHCEIDGIIFNMLDCMEVKELS